jgi:hypothetical protein
MQRGRRGGGMSRGSNEVCDQVHTREENAGKVYTKEENTGKVYKEKHQT